VTLLLTFERSDGEESSERGLMGRQATRFREVGALLRWVGLVIDVYWGGLLDLGAGVPAYAGTAMRLGIFSQVGCKDILVVNGNTGNGCVGSRYDGWIRFVDQVFLE
jgi:hypothetical protein